jgi:hypothetical protein
VNSTVSMCLCRSILLCMLSAPSLIAATASPALAAYRGVGQDASESVSQVGMSQSLREHVIPGGEVEVRTVDESTAVIIRLADTRPHGDSYRYDIVWYGLDPGSYNLLDYLRRKDGSSLDDLPPVPIRVTSILPEGIVKPNQLETRGVPTFSSYHLMLWVGGILWLAAMIAVLRMGRRDDAGTEAQRKRKQSMAERLQPLVSNAMSGEMSSTERAELELLLVAYWRKKRGLEDLGAAESLRRLRDDKEAGPLLRQLEEWLHQPEPRKEVDLAVLLKPYESLPIIDEVAASSAGEREEVPLD